MSNRPCFKANIINNMLEGKAAYYFKNGKISEEGSFKNNVRTGIWKYYYPNGRLEKVYSYDSMEPVVLEAYNKNGKATVVNGNGKISTEFRNFMECYGFKTEGSVLNGRKNGKWTFSNLHASMPIATETYQEGVFVKGISNYREYTERPSIKLRSYYPNENLSLIENILCSPGGSGICFCTYGGRMLSGLFYPELQAEASKHAPDFKNQWLVVGIKIGKNGSVKEINIASSIDDTGLENWIYAIIKKMDAWKAAIIDSKPVESSIYFSILADGNRLIILPDYYHKL